MKIQVPRVSVLHRSRQGHGNGSRPETITRRPQSSRINIVVAQHHPITLAGLQALLAGERDFIVAACCVDGHDAVRAVRTYEPDVLVVDQELPGIDGIEILKHLRSAGLRTRLVILAPANNRKLAEAISLNVEGIVLKSSEPKHMIGCLREVYAGRRWLDSGLETHRALSSAGMHTVDTLTPRQLEVARAAVSGLSNKELAQRLGVSEGTIKNHLHAIYERLQLEGRLALLLYLKEQALA